MEEGPTLGVHVEYEIDNDKIASIDRYSGRLLASSIGNTVRCEILLRFNIPLFSYFVQLFLFLICYQIWTFMHMQCY